MSDARFDIYKVASAKTPETAAKCIIAVSREFGTKGKW